MGKDDQPIVGLSAEDRDIFWDEMYAKEEGVIREFDFNTKTGKIRCLADGEIYLIDARALAQTKIELKIGDKVLFAPFEDPDGKNYAKIMRIIELSV
jgi:hypothetical protein